MSEFEEFWKAGFLDTGPVGFMLRTRFEERWIRFHSLPLSKRYAESDAERDIIWDRANALASAVLEDTQCWLAVSSPNVTNGAVEPLQKRFNLEEAFTWREDDEDDSPMWTVYANHTHWVEDRFKALILSIADDTGPRAVWVSSKSKSIFAPYDGGFDLILPDRASTQVLKQKYAAWLSPRPDSL